MLLWHFFKTMVNRREADDSDDSDESYADNHEHEFDDEQYDADEPVARKIESDSGLQVKPEQLETLPRLLKFSLVARDDQGFNGEVLFDALERAGLCFGSVRVFERLDKQRMVLFAVGCMSEDGVFPDHDLAEFYCPGIVFYLTPREVAQPLVVFDEFMETIDTLATELQGVVWDNQRQPLTAETIAQIRHLFL